MTLLNGKDAIDLYYFGPAHTNGDTLSCSAPRASCMRAMPLPTRDSRSSIATTAAAASRILKRF